MRRIKLPLIISEELARKNEGNLIRIADGKKGNWNSMTSLTKKTVVSNLLLAQKSLCAYCESRLYSVAAADKRGNLHIEHVKEKQDHPKLTYVYTNFVLSCHGGMNKFAESESLVEQNQRVQSISCGHYKSDKFHKNTSVDHTKLLDPYANPYSNYFSYNEEVLVLKKGLSDKDVLKAIYTINRLNLNADRLQFARLAIIRQVRKDLDSYKQKAAQKRYITNLIKENQEIYPPFVSLIKHHFSWVLNVK